MLTYTAEALKALDIDHPLPGVVRKPLFTLHLWRQANHRKSVGLQQMPKLSQASRRRSADRSMSIVWLNVPSLRNKTDAVQQTIAERSIDILALSEMWHNSSDDVCLRLSAPPGYAVADAACTTGRGGGIAIVYRQHLKCSMLPMPEFRSLEVSYVRLVTTSGPVVIIREAIVSVFRGADEFA